MKIEKTLVTDPLATEMIEVVRGEKYSELIIHLGNVLVTISDQKLAVDNMGQIAYYPEEVMTFTEYYPFGSVMSERSWTAANGYRYGFNGKEKDDEFSVEDGRYDFGSRMYDARLSRWWSVDPLFYKYSNYSSYVFVLNSPIWMIDLVGEEPIVVNGELVGYRVEAGQGPSQIAEDLNDPKTQKLYGYKLHTKVTFYDIVVSNPSKFENVKNRNDIRDPEFKKLNLNAGDELSLISVRLNETVINLKIKMHNDGIKMQIKANNRKIDEIEKEDSGPVMSEADVKEQQEAISDGYDGEATRGGEGPAKLAVRVIANRINRLHDEKVADKNRRIIELKSKNSELQKKLLDE